MKKHYYIISLALATGMLAGCSNDVNDMDEIRPIENTDNTVTNQTRNFPQDDGAIKLKGEAAEMLWQLLPGADDAFPKRRASYNITDQQYRTIKEFTDELVVGRTTESQKYRAIYSWVTKNIKYNTELKPYSNDPYDVFINRVCVCQGYANILNVMLHTQGIDVINVNGFLNPVGGHAWNYVRHGGIWWVSDPTNAYESKAELVDNYKKTLSPISADGNILENDEYAFNYVNGCLNLNTVKVADDVMMVPFSATFNNGVKVQINSFCPTEPVPENVREIYIGTNITTLGSNGIIGLNEYAPSVEMAYVDPGNTSLRSYAGAIYRSYSPEPMYVPTAMTRLELMPTEVLEKGHVYQFNNIEELVVPQGTKRIEAWAVEYCSNLKVAYVPTDTEIEENAFTKLHSTFKIIRQDQTGIKEVKAN